jgi:hypothetical protein
MTYTLKVHMHKHHMLIYMYIILYALHHEHPHVHHPIVARVISHMHKHCHPMTHQVHEFQLKIITPWCGAKVIKILH